MKPHHSQLSRKKMSRIRRACDTCNVKRTKCDGSEPCSHCLRLKVECTYLRTEKKRGRASDKYPKEIKKRKPKNLESSNVEMSTGTPTSIASISHINTRSTSTLPVISPPIIHSHSTEHMGLVQHPHIVTTPLSVTNRLQLPEEQLSGQSGLAPSTLISKYPLMYTIENELRLLAIPFNVADELLEYYFGDIARPSTNVFSILRRASVLIGKRPMHPTLLLTLLLASTIQTDHCFFAGSRREQTYRMMFHIIQERLVRDPYRLVYDEFIAVIHICYFQPWLAYPKDSVTWWKLACETVRVFMRQQSVSTDEELREEERRAWWAVYILDRITSFSFNMPPMMEDSEFFEIYIPCDELFWAKSTESPLAPEMDSSRRRFVDYNHDVSRGIYGWFLPLAQLMAKLYEYKRDQNSPRQLQSIIFAQHGILHHNIVQMERTFEGQLLIPQSDSESFKIDLLYAKYINLCIGFMTQYIQSHAIVSGFESDMEKQEYDRLVSCVEVLEKLLKLDPEMKRYPFLLGFFLFTIGYSVLQILNNVNAATVRKINKFNYLVNVLVRVMETVLIHFPAEFLKTLRNLLVRSLQDCEKLILLQDHLPQFQINAEKRKEALRSYSWLPETGKGLAL